MPKKLYLLHRYNPAFKDRSVQVFDAAFGLLQRRHRHETKTTRFSRPRINNEVDVFNLNTNNYSIQHKQITQITNIFQKDSSKTQLHPIYTFPSVEKCFSKSLFVTRAESPVTYRLFPGFSASLESQLLQMKFNQIRIN